MRTLEIPEGLLVLARQRRFRRRALIVQAESPAEHVYVVLEGLARVFLLSPSGEETTTALLGPGQLVGIAPLLGRPTYHAFAEALTDVRAWALPGASLLDELARDPEAMAFVLAALAHRLALAEALLGRVRLLPLAERIPYVLARLETCLGGAHPSLTHQVLADLVGARRESVTRAVAPVRAAVA